MKEHPEITNPLKIIGEEILYKLIPAAFIAVHSFSFIIVPKLKIVEMRTDIGNPILINQGIV